MYISKTLCLFLYGSLASAADPSLKHLKEASTKFFVDQFEPFVNGFRQKQIENAKKLYHSENFMRSSPEGCQMQLWTFIDGKIYLEENTSRVAEGRTKEDVERWGKTFTTLIHEPEFPKHL